MQAGKQNYKIGLLAALSCALIWGLLPIYWKLLIPIPSSVIILYRVSLAGIVCFIWAVIKYGWEEVKKPFKNRRLVMKYIVAGLIITGNWSIYIAAVNAGFIIQTGIGYYIEPLLVCAFGIVLFREQLTKYKAAAFSLAACAVFVLLIHYGEFPTIALGLAFTFAVYAAVKKTCHEPAVIALFYETVFLILPTTIAIVIIELKGGGAFSYGQPYQWVLIMFAGALTLIPLVFFGIAAKNLPLVSLGITEYIAPTMSIFIGLFYGEELGLAQLVAFAFLAVALTIFTIGEYKEQKQS